MNGQHFTGLRQIHFVVRLDLLFRNEAGRERALSFSLLGVYFLFVMSVVLVGVIID